ncbi:sigma factor-like helix-turn-helix DNA-binding protein [Actinophytocola xanthii]|uniref:sigma factor-like helix-turn-helix DNA-binding protein n=1 Tax=Actinophytocola xanthii TaxID=1912961 RepID=UPI001E57DE21|nr:sigma factor-like helix-turn-helix DNA-binding protein [Actinophytocola xanthii]
MVTDGEEGEVGEVVARAALAVDVRGALASLPPREALVLTRRYGLDDGAPHTLLEIGEEIGVSRERVRQLERNGLARLRTSDRSQPLLPWAG